MLAARCYQDNEAPKRLLPQDPTGKRFVQYFHHGWGFIHAPMPKQGERPNWHTEKRYPLQPRNLWSHYCNKETLLGLSFGSETNYMLLDIDHLSANHPENNRERYEGILEALEDIGLCRPVPLLSSDSNGIHLYYFLPHLVHSFTLAATVKHTLEKAGYTVRGGQLEIFPNAKPYNPGKPTSFKAHRLPLQQRSFLLDWDLQPVSQDIAILLNWADWSAAGQDLELLTTVMQQNWHCFKKAYCRHGKKSVEQWHLDLQAVIQQGFTGFGQTNLLLLACACFGIVFLNKQGTALYDYVLETITSASGYHQYCRHQHEIEVRVRDVVRSAEAYYYPYPGNPPRDKTYKEHFGGTGEGGKVVPFLHPSQKRHEETLARITAVVATLKGTGKFPPTAYQRTQAIIAQSKEAYGVGVSQTTLHKVEYLPLWHPAYERTEERVNPYPAVEKYLCLPDPWDEVEVDGKSVIATAFSDLHVTPLYEGFLLPPAKAGGEELTIPEDGNFQNSPEDRSFFHTTILQLSSSSVIVNPEASSSFPDAVSREFLKVEKTDKNCQYLLSATAQPEKPEILDKQNLSIFETLTDAKVDQDQSLCLQSGSDVDGDIDINITATNTPSVSTSISVPGSIPTDPLIFSPRDNASVVSLLVPSLAAEGGEAPVDISQPPIPEFTPEQYRDTIRIKLKALPLAKHWVRVFCTTEGIHLMPAQRVEMEQVVKYHLMLKSPSPILQQEAQQWFAEHSRAWMTSSAFSAKWQRFLEEISGVE